MSNSVNQKIYKLESYIHHLEKIKIDNTWNNEYATITMLESDLKKFKESIEYYKNYYSINKPKKKAKALRPTEAPDHKEVKYLTFDLETENWKDFLCFGFYNIDDDHYEYHDNLEIAIIEAFKYCKGARINNIFAHNGGKFDFMFILEGIFRKSNKKDFEILSLIPRGSGFLSMEVLYKPINKKLIIRDTLHFLPMSLRKLGEAYQVETPKDDIDYLYLGPAFRNENYIEKIFSDIEEDINGFVTNRNKVFYKGKYYGSYEIFLRKNYGKEASPEHITYQLRKDVISAEKDIELVKKNPLLSDKEKEKNIKKINDRIMRYRHYNKDDVKKYLKIDCVCLAQIMRNHFNSPIIKDAGISFTSAGQAIKIFQRYLKHVIYPSTEEEDAFVRKAYLGGRTELFKYFFDGEYDLENNPLKFKKETLEVLKNQQGKVIHCYDANSLYPSQMMMNDFPLKFVGIRTGKKYYDHFDYGVWKVKVFIPYMEIPPLGLQKTFSNGDVKLVFPANGEFEGWWTKHELEYAKTLGVEILEYHEGACYSNAQPIFKEFIEKMYNTRLEARQRGDTTTAEICKLAMNSCYGKLGQSPEEREVIVPYGGYMFQQPITIYTEDREEINLCKMVSNSSEMFSKVILACYVTSYARIYMHKQIMKVGHEHIYYMDTDSLFTTKEMESGNKLGEMKHEYTYKSAVFILPKAYAVYDGLGIFDRSKKVLKGVDRVQGQSVPIIDLVNYFKGDIAEIKTIRKEKFMTCGEAFGNNVFLGVSGNLSFEELNIGYRMAEAQRLLDDATGKGNKKAIQSLKGKIKNLKLRLDLSRTSKYKSIKKIYDKRERLPDMINTIPLGGFKL